MGKKQVLSVKSMSSGMVHAASSGMPLCGRDFARSRNGRVPLDEIECAVCRDVLTVEANGGEGQPDQWRADWTDTEDRKMLSLWGYIPISRLAQILGRSVEGVRLHEQVRGWTHPLDTGIWLTAKDVTSMFGVTYRTAIYWMEHRFFDLVEPMYRGDRRVMAISSDRMKRWLRDPMNWPGLRLEKARKDVLRVVRNVGWQDEWIGVECAAKLSGYSVAHTNRLLREAGEQLTVKQPGKRKWYLRSEVEMVIGGSGERNIES